MAIKQFTDANTYRFSPPKPIQDYPKDSLKKMAVLFTDIVSSSHYFKTHGDIAGRKMLQRHQDMASPIIAEFEGTVVKFLGDSVMAYYLNPTEALKSAIKIQQRFQKHNKTAEKIDQIHIRICVHYGEGIIEENDIFGDVVNMAAKLLTLVGGDQIFISEDMHRYIKRSSSIQFEQIEVSDKNELLKKLTIYKVIWDETLQLESNMKSLLLVRPVWNIGKKNFPEVWNDMIKSRINFWSKKDLVKENIAHDKSLALILKDIPTTVTVAKNIIKFLGLNLGHDAANLLPVQVIIDSGPFFIAGRISLSSLKVNWDEIAPGEIHVSSAAKNYLDPAITLVPVGSMSNSNSHAFFKIQENDNSKNSQNFLYQNSMLQGEDSPCFYCGDGRHHQANCPSKQLTEMTNFIEKMGYRSMNEINNMFFKFLNEPESSFEGVGNSSWTKGDNLSQWARLAFFELKTVFQLRLFRTIWSQQEDNWNKIKLQSEDRNKGGLLWIALDCIRVSNYKQAESILADTITNDSKDYKVFCIAGLFHIDRGDFEKARLYLDKAYNYAKSTPQRITVLFLISRIYSVSNDHIKEKKTLGKILRLNAFCHEAAYLEIKIRFRHENRKDALKRLIKLVKTNRDYYIIALIDPELSNFSEEIRPRIENLYTHAKEEALKIYPKACDEMYRLENLIGKDSPEMSEARSMLSRLDELLKTESYFGFIDIIHFGSSMTNISNRVIEGRERSLTKKILNIKRRIQKCQINIGNLHHSMLTLSITRDLNLIQKKSYIAEDKIETHEPSEYEDLQKSMNQLGEDLRQVENKISRLDGFVQLIDFGIAFMKKSLIFQSANLFLGLIFLPIMTHYLSFMMPNLNIDPHNIWHYQKIFMSLGGISGIILASLTTKLSLSKNAS